MMETRMLSLFRSGSGLPGSNITPFYPDSIQAARLNRKKPLPDSSFMLDLNKKVCIYLGVLGWEIGIKG